MQKIEILKNEIAYSTMTEKCMLIDFRNRLNYLINNIDCMSPPTLLFHSSVLVQYLFKLHEKGLIVIEQLGMIIDSITEIIEDGGIYYNDI